MRSVGFSGEINCGIHLLGSEGNDIIKQYPGNQRRTVPKPFISTNPTASNNKQTGSSAFRLGYIYILLVTLKLFRVDFPVHEELNLGQQCGSPLFR